jgi:ComF family protein
MSNWLAVQTFRALTFSAIRSWGVDCPLCVGPSARSLVCEECDRALPVLEIACVRCAAPLGSAGTCGECQRHEPAFDEAVAAFGHRFPVDRLIHRFNCSGDLAVGRRLALRLAERVASHDPPDLLVAPPLTDSRLRARGFNQAAVIARHVGRRLRVRHSLTAFAKVRDTSPQAGLGRRQRLANLREAFRCELRLSGEHVAIVDDVMTTGATAHTLSKLLKANGASRVSVWAIARTPDPSRKA